MELCGDVKGLRRQQPLDDHPNEVGHQSRSWIESDGQGYAGELTRIGFVFVRL